VTALLAVIVPLKVTVDGAVVQPAEPAGGPACAAADRASGVTSEEHVSV
jgi:hypothetical protein